MAASIPDRSVVEKAQVRLKRHGARNLAHTLLMKAINLAVPFKILRGVYVEKPAALFLTAPQGYEAKFLGEAELRAFAADPDNEMSADFVDAVMQKGDECYAILDGANLAAYGWYAMTPTAVGPGLLLRFSEAYVYMYKGFTGERYRGKRLHAIGMTRALRHYLSKGYKGIVSYVESINFDSLKSCFRMGYSVFGTVYVIKAFGRYYGFSTPGCRKYAFRVERAAGSSPPSLIFGK